jgi:hypothetical protein
MEYEQNILHCNFGSFMTSCSSGGSSEVMKLGPDTFKVEASAHNIFGGGSPEARNESLKMANSHCSKLGKEIFVTNKSSNFERPFYRHTVTFRCLDKNDPALVRAVYEKEADVVIKQK